MYINDFYNADELSYIWSNAHSPVDMYIVPINDDSVIGFKATYSFEKLNKLIN